MHIRRDFMPGKAKIGPELFIHAVEDVEIGREIGGAGNVAITEIQHAGGGKGLGHLGSVKVGGTLVRSHAYRVFRLS